MLNQFGVKGKFICLFSIVMPVIFIIMVISISVLLNYKLKTQAENSINMLNEEKKQQEKVMKEAVRSKANSILKILATKSAVQIVGYDFDGLASTSNDGATDKEIDYVNFYDTSGRPLTEVAKKKSAQELQIDVTYDGNVVAKAIAGYNYTYVNKGIGTLESRIAAKATEFEDAIATALTEAITFVAFGALVATLFCIGIIYLMIERLVMKPVVGAVKEVNAISTILHKSSTTIAEASKNLSVATADQASSVEETSASLEEIRAMVSNNVSEAEASSNLADEVKDMYSKGHESMTKLSGAMDQIEGSNSKIQELVNVIQQIAASTQVIDEIVFQTKLLSFNASVEAERAGEHGRGFAVVAQEVGSLSTISGDAAQKISNIVKDSIVTTTEITTENKSNVDQGGELLVETTSILGEISQNINKVSDSGKKIQVSSREQSVGVDQISEAVHSLDKITHDNSVTADEISNVSSDVLNNSENLKSVVSKMEEIVYGSKAA